MDSAAEIIAATVRLPLAAQRASIPERTVRSWVESGRLTGWRVGGRLRVRQADVEALVQLAEPKPQPRPRPAPPPSPPAGPGITRLEAAKRLGVHVCTIREWVEQGKLRGQQVDGRWVVEESSVAALERMRRDRRGGW